ncbi:MAG: C-terminal binding protein [Actinomycetota bacterium]|nr:C-terminal binding protein [Actinomycetota bacterium]
MTTTTTVAILGTRYGDFAIEERVFGGLGVSLRSGMGASADDIVAEAGDAELILAGGSPQFDAAVIERLNCRAIVRYGVGVDSVDLDAASRSGMWVSYVPDYGTDAVALHTVSLLLASLRGLMAADALVKGGGWGLKELRPLHLPQALTVGIVGLGRIGRRVAELLSPFSFKLLGFDVAVDAVTVEPPLKPASFEELLRVSDVVTLHVPGPSDGGALLGARELGWLKEGSLIVNTARGSLIDLDALTRGLREGRPARAALDVFAPEPPEAVFESVSEHVILTPHMAWYTEESERDLREKAAQEALRILEGRPPLHVATRPQGQP